MWPSSGQVSELTQGRRRQMHELPSGRTPGKATFTKSGASEGSVWRNRNLWEQLGVLDESRGSRDRGATETVVHGGQPHQPRSRPLCGLEQERLGHRVIPRPPSSTQRPRVSSISSRTHAGLRARVWHICGPRVGKTRLASAPEVNRGCALEVKISRGVALSGRSQSPRTGLRRRTGHVGGGH